MGGGGQRVRFLAVVKIPPPGTGAPPTVDGAAEVGPTVGTAGTEAAGPAEGVEQALQVEAPTDLAPSEAALLQQLDEVFRDELERILGEDQISAGRLGLLDE